MSYERNPPRIFPTAAEDVDRARNETNSTAQIQSPSYKLAFDDHNFILRDEMRPVRLLLELSKPDLIMREHGIQDTVVVFGSARSPSLEAADTAYQEANNLPDNTPEKAKRLKQATKLLEHAGYYEQSRTFSRLLTEKTARDFGKPIHIITGGGPGIMEAANRGCAEASGKSIGLNIVLPKEQTPNPYITPELCFQFHYFAMRKMHFLMRAKALVAFPGGYGTLDELFETLTLIQTKKIAPLPVILFGREYWDRIIHWEALVEEGMISEEDLALFQYASEPGEAVDIIIKFLQSR